jgi:hypothetical protein
MCNYNNKRMIAFIAIAVCRERPVNHERRSEFFLKKKRTGGSHSG